MARERYLVGVPARELQPTPPPPPDTPRSRWENFWYYHKWKLLGVLFALVVAGVLLAQLLGKNTPDYTLLLVTKQGYFNAELAPLEQLLERYGQDLDGDGRVEVQIITCRLGESTDRQTQLANFQSLQVHLATGDVMLFAFEPEYYDWFMSEMEEKEHHFLASLPAVSDGVQEDGCSWNWANDPRVADNAAFDALPRQLCFGVRAPTGTAQKRTEEYEQCMALLEALITDTPTN